MKHPLTRTLDEFAHWQRKFAAEMKLNFNPGAWINNFLSGNHNGHLEGAQSLDPTTVYREAMQGAYHLQGPWARAQAGLEGEVTGAAAYMGSAGGSIFRATTWTDRLFGEPTRMPAAPSTPAASSKTPTCPSSTTRVNLPAASMPYACPG